jgi:hypothetical protein
MSKYTVNIFSLSGDFVKEVRDVDTITEGRRLAEDWGDMADSAEIVDRAGYVVAYHKRSPEGNGMRWYKAAVLSRADQRYHLALSRDWSSSAGR